MEFQYTTLDTEVGTFTLVRVFSTDDAEIATGEHFREYFSEEIGDEDIVVLHRNEYGEHEWLGFLPIDLSDDELDAQLWVEGEWLV
jgi:hypothetical protein